MKAFVTAALAAVSLSFLGCGGGGGGSGGGQGGDETPITLSSLSEAERQAFEAWKLRPVKACAWHEAFPKLAEAFPPPSGVSYSVDPKVDVDQFVRFIGESPAEGSRGLPILEGSAGELAMFDAPTADWNLETDNRSGRRTVNGVVTSFDATSEWTDGVCVITLGGEELFRARLASELPVILGYDPALPKAEPVALDPLQETEEPGGTAARLKGTALLSGAQAALKPTANTQEFLARAFGLTSAQAQGLFPLGAPLALASATLTAVGTAPVDPALVTPFRDLRFLYARSGTSGESVLESIYAPGSVSVDLLFLPPFGPAEKLIRLPASISIAAGSSAFYAQLSSIRLGSWVERTDAAAVDCFQARYAASTPWANTTAPTREFAGVYDLCASLSPDPRGALASDPAARRVVVGEVEKTIPQSSYSGWDSALIDLVDAMITRGVGLNQVPTGLGPYSLSARTEDLSRYLDAVADADSRRLLQRELVQLAYDQHFTYRPLLETNTALIGALQKASKPFTESTRQMLKDLVASNRTAGLRAVSCGAALTDAQIGAIQATVADAQSYDYGKGFGDHLRGTVLQACYVQADLDQATAAVSAARAFTEAELARAPGISFAREHQELVDRALDERWTADTYSALADVLGFALVSEYTHCVGRGTLSEQAKCTGDLTGVRPWISAAEGGMLSPAFGGRYPALARDLRTRFTTQLDPTTHFNARYDIQTAYFGQSGLWLGCDPDAFGSRRAQLLAGLDELVAETTFEARYAIEQQITALVSGACMSPG